MLHENWWTIIKLYSASGWTYIIPTWVNSMQLIFKQDIPLNLYKLCDGNELHRVLSARSISYFTCVLRGKAPYSQEQGDSKTSLAPSLSCIMSSTTLDHHNKQKLPWKINFQMNPIQRNTIQMEIPANLKCLL